MTSECVEKYATLPKKSKKNLKNLEKSINYRQKIDITMEVIRLHYY